MGRLSVSPLELREKDLLQSLLEEAFPVDEILPLDYYLEYKSTPGVMVYSFYDEEGDFIGFMQTVEGNKVVYLSYLAFFKKYQCLGYGSQAIQWLKDHFPSSPIAVDREVIEEYQGQPRLLAERRAAFYKRNGFENVSCYQYQLGVIYQTMAYQGFCFEDLKGLIEGIAHHGDPTYWPYYFRTYGEAREFALAHISSKGENKG